ncbi:MAG: nucleoside-diphosphate kinase [Nitrososphaeraceae archaeon]
MGERTLVVIKPDGVKRKLAGKIISRFEEKGFTIEILKSYSFTTEKAKDFYSAHSNKPFFNELVSFITSGPTMALILDGNSAINAVRLMIGSTKSYEAAPGTIRGDLALNITDNIIHASDSYESFIKEAGVIFNST